MEPATIDGNRWLAARVRMLLTHA